VSGAPPRRPCTLDCCGDTGERRCPPELGLGASLVHSNTRSESPVVARSSVVGDF
ncbi:hypothetical protein BGY98DRAFT_1053848, partial [Russula aff. rugulosa BPL654]